MEHNDDDDYDSSTDRRRVKRARSDAGASGEQALAIPPPGGGNGGGGIGGGGEIGGGGGISNDIKTRSKRMMSVLRYPHVGVLRDSDGWAPLEQVMRAMRSRFTELEIREVVENNLYPNGMPRFETRGDYVRAVERRRCPVRASPERKQTRWL